MDNIKDLAGMSTILGFIRGLSVVSRLVGLMVGGGIVARPVIQIILASFGVITELFMLIATVMTFSSTGYIIIVHVSTSGGCIYVKILRSIR